MARVVLPIHRGDRGSNVVKVQRKVGATADGDFGPITERAVRVWQRKHKLLVDGIVGPKTWAHMFPVAAVVKPPVVITRPPTTQPPIVLLSGVTIVNDIGHGLNNTRRGVYDPGATAGGKQEHVLAEAFVALLTTRERAEGASVTVTHDLPLTARTAASAADATSWHLNAGGGHGVEVWIPLLASPASKAKSDRIGRAVAAALGLPYRTTSRRGFAVLNRGFDRLVELGFIDSTADRLALSENMPAAVEAVIANL